MLATNADYAAALNVLQGDDEARDVPAADVPLQVAEGFLRDAGWSPVVVDGRDRDDMGWDDPTGEIAAGTLQAVAIELHVRHALTITRRERYASLIDAHGVTSSCDAGIGRYALLIHDDARGHTIRTFDSVAAADSSATDAIALDRRVPLGLFDLDATDARPSEGYELHIVPAYVGDYRVTALRVVR